jgi:type I restriction enzyme, S subunit
LRVAEPSAKYIVERETSLVRGFELLATSAGAIVKLRELILSLAVQGGLVPQESKDSSAELLFTQIRMEINGQAKPSDADPPLIAEPFALPSTWEWTQLGEVVEVIRGITFPASEKTREPAPNRIACLRTTNVQHSIEWEDLLFVDRSFMGREDQLIRHHDIVMSMANSRELVGKVALIEHVPHPEATFGGFLGVLRTHHVEPRYVMAVLRTRYARTALIGSASQTTNIANISLGKLRPLPFPLPPLAEQLRIVARVEELMKLCDALEQSGRLADEQHARLTSTLFDALAASESAHALAENWQRIAEHFDLLLDRPEAIAALEQTILQLAVRGLLVPQLVSDEPARSAWLGADIAEAPYEVPSGWEWRSVESIAKVGTGTTPSRTNTLL